MSTNEWVRQARKHARLTQDGLAEMLEMSKGNVSGWENGRHKPSFEQMKRISALTGFPLPLDDLGNASPAPIGARKVPVISAIQAGMWSEIVDHFEPGEADDWLLTDLELSANSFALTIRGNSMLPEFNPGDRVIIDPAVSPHPGDFVAAKNGDQEATFKKYRPRGMDAAGNMVFELVPLNEDYPTLRSDIQPIRIVGTMVEHRKYRRPR
jgi:SOS-response transcriptional repressor LexA